MPLFFIETLVGETRYPDRIGTAFPDPDAAIKTALRALIDIAQDESDLLDDLDVSICVRDFAGQPIFSGLLQTSRSGKSGREAERLAGAEERPEARLQSA